MSDIPAVLFKGLNLDSRLLRIPRFRPGDGSIAQLTVLTFNFSNKILAKFKELRDAVCDLGKKP